MAFLRKDLATKEHMLASTTKELEDSQTQVMVLLNNVNTLNQEVIKVQAQCAEDAQKIGALRNDLAEKETLLSRTGHNLAATTKTKEASESQVQTLLKNINTLTDESRRLQVGLLISWLSFTYFRTPFRMM